MGFPLFMLLMLLLTGIIWLVDYLFFEAKRVTSTTEPTAVEYAKSFFPVILLVFVIRSFIAEPFKIPSASMNPTLLAGDYILVNKFTYGLRVPVWNSVFLNVSEPKRGDVMVFHFPPNPKIDYIKRVIGLPGDRIQYQDKQLTINGQQVAMVALEGADYEMQGESIIKSRQLEEQLPNMRHNVLLHNMPNRYVADSLGGRFLNGETVIVPEGHYYVMGDNRDNSSDSRVWGFVPERNLVGRAFSIWFNFDDFSRIGDSIH
ncbi:MAG: signal peptidase I [Methylophilaceae bacterium]